jgi:hypothetical protein
MSSQDTSLYRKRAEENFVSAARELQKSIPENIHDRLGKVSFPKLDGIDGVENKAAALADAMEGLIQARVSERKEKGRKNKVGDMMMSWFRASYPFVTLFLTVAKDGSAVSSITITDLIPFPDPGSQSLPPTLWRLTCLDEGISY